MINHKKYGVCPDCHGKGLIPNLDRKYKKCKSCDGKGVVKRCMVCGGEGCKDCNYTGIAVYDDVKELR